MEKKYDPTECKIYEKSFRLCSEQINYLIFRDKSIANEIERMLVDVLNKTREDKGTLPIILQATVRLTTLDEEKYFENMGLKDSV